MAQFYNASPNFANFASGETALAIGADNLVQNNGKRNLFSQNWSGNDAKKKRQQDFYNILIRCVRDEMTKTDTACASKIYFQNSWSALYGRQVLD